MTFLCAVSPLCFSSCSDTVSTGFCGYSLEIDSGDSELSWGTWAVVSKELLQEHEANVHTEAWPSPALNTDLWLSST